MTSIIDNVIDGTNIIPPHFYTDADKVAKIAESMAKDGWTGRPVLVVESGNDGIYALTGSHRLAAADAADIDVPVVYVDDAVLEYESDNGEYLMDVIGTGDDRVYSFLAEAGDARAAAMMDVELALN